MSAEVAEAIRQTRRTDVGAVLGMTLQALITELCKVTR